jgi:heptosyltransferase II
MRMGIFLPNWVGDVVMATPALRALRGHFGDRARLVGIMRPYVTEVLAGSSWLDHTLVYDRKSVSGVRRLIARLRRQRLDCVLLLTNSLSTSLFAWLAGTPRRIGYARDGRSWLLTDPLTTPRDRSGLIPRSAVDHYLEVTRVLAFPGNSTSCRSWRPRRGTSSWPTMCGTIWGGGATTR